MEHRLHAKNGEYRWHLNRAKPLLDEHGKACQWYGAGRCCEWCFSSGERVILRPYTVFGISVGEHEL
ncbi:MAG: hypothetical protein ACOVOS_06295 [Chitinophagaceae bacterium]